MPELPEVAALAAELHRRLSGRPIQALRVLSVACLRTVDPPPEALAGARVRSVSRRGKFLILTAEAEPGELDLVVHLARAGWIRWREGPPPAPRPRRSPIAAQLVLDDGSGVDLTEAGSKKALAIWVVRDPLEVPGIARLGPEPLDPAFSLEQFSRILASAGRARIKGVLRDQSLIAGIGNAYSDEILHAARMSPFTPASMPPEQVASLYEAMRSILAEAVERADGLAASELKGEKKSAMRVHGRTGQPCPVCGDTVRQIVYADWSLQYCPGCQTDGAVLADRALSRLLK